MRTVSRNDVRDGKPDPEPYLRAAWLAGIDPEDCAVMEDSHPGSIGGPCGGHAHHILAGGPTAAGPPGALNADSAEAVRAYLGLG